MKPVKIQGFILYRIFYGDTLVYVGRTKQPLQDRLRGHFFQKPMHRKIHIECVTRIEYAEFKTEADMNLYEIFYILRWKPPLNVDDTTRDKLTVSLPDVAWSEWNASIFQKWMSEIDSQKSETEKAKFRLREIPEEQRVVKNLCRTGKISEDEKYTRLDALQEEYAKLSKKIGW